MTRSIARGLILLGSFFALAGCSSGSSETGTNYVPVDAVSLEAASTETATDAAPDAQSTDRLATNDAGSDPALEAEVDRVVQVFDSFLALRAQAVTGDLSLDELSDVATPGAIDQVEQLRNENDARLARDSYAAWTDLAEWSNISLIDRIGEQLVFTDCTERQHVTPGGFTVVSFVTNNVAIVDDGQQLKVSAVVTAQDGIVATEPGAFGCVPPSFAEQAELIAASTVEQVEQMIADPAAALDQGLPSIFGDQARTGLEQGLESLVAQGLTRVADESVELAVIGMDVNRPDFTIVVSVCRTYPTGRSYIDSNGDPTITDIPTGSTFEEWMYVQLGASSPLAPIADQVVAVQDRGLNCQKG